jgi:hypothetical protein
VIAGKPLLLNFMLDAEQDINGQFAMKIMGWQNLRYEDTGEEGLKLFGEVKVGNEWKDCRVPDYGTEPMALWSAETYIVNAGLRDDYVTELTLLTQAGDLTDPKEIFKLINASPLLKVRAAVQAYDKAHSSFIDSEPTN